MAATADSSSRRVPDWDTHTGSTTSGNLRWASTGPRALMMSAEKSMPVLAARTFMSEVTAWYCWTTNSAGTGWMPLTATVFWAVSAVMTDAPYPPSMAKVLRSAWMPAPPPESDPATVRIVEQSCMAGVSFKDAGWFRRKSTAPEVITPGDSV